MTRPQLHAVLGYVCEADTQVAPLMLLPAV